MAEGIAHRLFRRVVIAVAHIHAFAVFCIPLSKGIFGKDIRIGNRPCLRQLATGICFSGQKIGNGLTAGLPRQAHIDNRLDFIRPRQLHCAAAQQHHHSIAVCRRHRFNHAVVPRRKPHMLPVKGFRFINLRQSCHHNGYLMSLGCLCRFLQGSVRHVPLRVAAGSKRSVRHGIGQIDQFCGVDMAAAGALIAQLLRHMADQDQIRRRKGQNTALVFQQHRALFGNSLSKCVVLVPIYRSRFRLLRLLHQTEDALHGRVDILLG